MEALTAGGWAILITFLGVCVLTLILGLRNWLRLSEGTGSGSPRRSGVRDHSKM
jgi:hypothetical protein